MTTRRLRLTAICSTLLALAACADPSGSTVPERPDETSSATGSAATVGAPSTTAPDVPADTAGVTSTTSTTSTSTSTTTSVEVVACSPVDVVVLGNSTDFWPEFVIADTSQPSDEAWPALLDERLAATAPDLDVTVANASVLGAGFDIGLYGVTSMHARLTELVAADQGEPTILLISPSVVDLQLRQLDVDASYAAFERLVDAAADAFDTILIAPMNPVATGHDPAVADAIADFNARLTRDGHLTPDHSSSPLLSDDGLTGAIEFFDDFDDERAGTDGPDPDLLHPDRDGHRTIAESVTAWLTTILRADCA